MPGRAQVHQPGLGVHHAFDDLACPFAGREQDRGVGLLRRGGARIVVIADFLFTASAVVLQPITGLLLARSVGYGLGEGWIVLSISLYLVTGAFWLPVVWIQTRMMRLASQAAEEGAALPPAYHRLFRVWFWFGFPAFGAVVGIFWLMIARPDLQV